MDDDLFLSDLHPLTRRRAIVEDDGRSAWLYLTAPESPELVAHCFLYNRVPAPPERNFARGETPVVPLTHVANGDAFQQPSPQDIFFRWSANGHAAAVFFGQEVFGFVTSAEKYGYSKHLKLAGPYGKPLDPGLYSSVFAEA